MNACSQLTRDFHFEVQRIDDFDVRSLRVLILSDAKYDRWEIDLRLHCARFEYRVRSALLNRMFVNDLNLTSLYRFVLIILCEQVWRNDVFFSINRIFFFDVTFAILILSRTTKIFDDLFWRAQIKFFLKTFDATFWSF